MTGSTRCGKDEAGMKDSIEVTTVYLVRIAEEDKVQDYRTGKKQP